MTVAVSPKDGVEARPVRTRRLDIQGLRGLAILMAVLFHARLPVPGGYIGVDIFFVISGYVITGLLMREWDARGRLSLRTFYSRRVRRLLPALSLTVSTTALAAIVCMSPYGFQQLTAKMAAGTALISSNVVAYRAGAGYFGADSATNPLLNMWSLSVEEQFYLAFPIFLVGLWKLRRATGRASVVYAGIIAVTIGSFVLSLATSYGRTPSSLIVQPDAFAYFSPFTRAWEFCAGILLALAAARLGSQPSWLRSLMGGLGVAILVVSAFVLTPFVVFPGWAVLLPVAGSALIIAAGVSGETRTTRWLASPGWVWLGDRSYAWYLWHWPFIVFASLLFPFQSWALPVAALVALGVAVVSYRAVEQRFRLATTSPAWVTPGRLVALCTAVPLVLASVLYVGAAGRWGGFFPEKSPAAWVSGVDRVGCLEPAFAQGVPAVCQLPSTSTSDRTALLVGDSHAGALGAAFATAAAAAGAKPSIAAYQACYTSPVSIYWKPGFRQAKDCVRFRSQLLRRVESKAPDLVVVAQRSPNFLEDPPTSHGIGTPYPCLEPESGCLTGAKGVAAWTDALHSLVTTLTAAGSQVLVVGTVPEFPHGTLSRPSMLDPKGTLGDDGTRARVQTQAFIDAERKAVESVPGARYLDPTSTICPGGRCAWSANGRNLYFDKDHLSVAGGQRLVPSLTRAMAQALGTNGAASTKAAS